VTLLIANYTDPQEKLRGLLSQDCATRAIFIEGEKNFGKSYLLKVVKNNLKERSHFVIVELDKRRSAPSPIEILTEIVDRLGWKIFPRLDAIKHELEGRRPIQATVANVSITGSYNNVQAIAQESEDDRLLLAMRVTREFLEDLRGLPSENLPLILAFDGYDPDLSLIDRWFDRSLIPGLSDIPHVRSIVCGRKVPETTVKSRTPPGCGVEIILKGVKDPEEWFPIISAMRRRIPGDAVLEKRGYLRGLIAAHKGAPGLIMTEIALFETEA
jgi:hypothetical protein